jgi:hypothetical protein
VSSCAHGTRGVSVRLVDLKSINDTAGKLHPSK